MISPWILGGCFLCVTSEVILLYLVLVTNSVVPRQLVIIRQAAKCLASQTYFVVLNLNSGRPGAFIFAKIIFRWCRAGVSP